MKVLRIDSAGTLREVNVSGDFGTINFAKEIRLITLAEQLSGYVELLGTPIENSVILEVGGTSQLEGIDYTVTQVLGVYRVNFINDLGFGGSAAIAESDRIVITYAVTPIVPSVEFRKKSVLLSLTDIMNQYVDLPEPILDLSEKFMCSGLSFVEGVHYNLEQIGGFTRVHFAGDLSSGGLSSLEPGDLIQVVYAVNV